MIRPLRQRHRWLVPLVALATALVLLWALGGRRSAEPAPGHSAESPR